ncbi:MULTISPECIES: hypothetical protein [unclassified Pseudomonas]
MSARLKVWGEELAAVFVRGYLRFSRILPTNLADASATGMVMNAKSWGHKVAWAVTTNSQGRQMLQNNREHLELERIMSEIRKLAAERKKLIAEEKKLRWDTYFYPFAVVTGVLTATAAVVGLSLKF